MPIVIVDVMPKPEILDPQGKAITSSLARLGHTGFAVRQGKRFEIEVEGKLTAARLAEVGEFAQSMLCNPVIETYTVRRLHRASTKTA
jgi:phosphoribosylformylglycinamidine synthase PurS subunit